MISIQGITTALVVTLICPIIVYGQDRPPFSIVHLGDSYSAGNGSRNSSFQPNFLKPDGCYRTSTNWGQLTADSLQDIFAVKYINRSCSGATFNHLTNIQTKFFGTTVIPPQLDVVNESVNLVLLTLGATDIGLGIIIEECFAQGYRSVQSCQDAINETNILIPFLEIQFRDALVNIGSLLNDKAKVMVVSYPNLISNESYIISENGTSLDVSAAIRKILSDIDIYINNAIKEANSFLGQDVVIFFDVTKDLFTGHEPNPSVESINESGWIWEVDDTIHPAEWYHLNPEGHTQLGAAVSDFIRQRDDIVPSPFQNTKSIDLAFVIDTTGSMSEEIASVRDNLNEIVSNLASSSADYRVAIASYQDFPVRCPNAYASRIDQPFTRSITDIQNGIASLTTQGGCDIPETVFSGIRSVLDLNWEDGATKSMIVIGDAPPILVNNEEPISGITADDLIQQSLALDPVAISFIDIGTLSQGLHINDIAEATGGSVVDTTDVISAVQTIIGTTSIQPFVWLGVSYIGQLNQPITFDASGSYDTSGTLISFEWDFNGDGIYDRTTTVPITQFVYTTAYTGIVLLRVTSNIVNLVGLGSTTVIVNAEGTVSMTKDVCLLDSNGNSIIRDEATKELFDCFPDKLPTEDIPGLKEESPKGCSIGFFGILCFFVKLWDNVTFWN